MAGLLAGVAAALGPRPQAARLAAPAVAAGVEVVGGVLHLVAVAGAGVVPARQAATWKGGYWLVTEA